MTIKSWTEALLVTHLSYKHNHYHIWIKFQDISLLLAL